MIPELKEDKTIKFIHFECRNNKHGLSFNEFIYALFALYTIFIVFVVALCVARHFFKAGKLGGADGET